jgi:hypothetical protein
VNTTILSGTVSGNTVNRAPSLFSGAPQQASIGNSAFGSTAGIAQVAQNVGSNGLIQQAVGVSTH